MQALTFFFAFVAVLALIGRRGVAGSPIRRQPPRRQHQSRTDAASGGDRCRRRGWPPAAGAGAARQRRTSADDRRPDRYRRGTQYRARDARTRSVAAAARRCAPSRRRRGWRRCPTPAWTDGDGAADGFDHAEPQMPEPPPRPVRPSFADEVRRPAPPRTSASSDPMRGDPMSGPGAAPAIRWAAVRSPAPSCAAEPMPSRVTSRSEPMMPRPPRPSEAPKAARPVRAAERPPPPPRRRRSLRCRRPTKISPRWRSGWKPRFAGHGGEPAEPRVGAPPVAPEPPPVPRRPQRATAGGAAGCHAFAEERL